MADPFRSEKIANWVSDFCEGEAAARLPAALRAVLTALLETFLAAACARRDVEPEEIGEEDVRSALAGDVTRLDIPREARGRVPDAIGAFLAVLETQGRLGDGRALGTYVRAHRGVYTNAAGPVVSPFRREASRLGPNDPCPCGSGRKFKKCCKRLGQG